MGVLSGETLSVSKGSQEQANNFGSPLRQIHQEFVVSVPPDPADVRYNDLRAGFGQVPNRWACSRRNILSFHTHCALLACLRS